MHIIEFALKILVAIVLSLIYFLPTSGQRLWQKDITIYFKTDVDDLGPDSKDIIRTGILAVGTTNIKQIKIYGNADQNASDTYNVDLSDRRAKNTANFLLSQGVRKSMIYIEALGESKPVSNENKFNRRVDIMLYYERHFSEAQVKRKKVIQGFVYNAKTNERISADYLSQNGHNQLSKKTSEKGFFRLKGAGTDDLFLTFIHSGFLNAHITLTADEIAGSVSDTIRLEIKLNPVEVVEKIILKNIYFYTDTHILKPESYPDLENLLQTLRENEQMLIEIQGHMNFPSNLISNNIQKEYNIHLSHRRAKAVYDYLVSNGIDRKRLSYRGMSNSKMIFPVPVNETQGDMNKRVEIWSLKIIS